MTLDELKALARRVEAKVSASQPVVPVKDISNGISPSVKSYLLKISEDEVFMKKEVARIAFDINETLRLEPTHN